MAGQFTLDLTKFVEKTKVKPSLIVKKIGMDMYHRIVIRTPVDTGRARANWQLTVNEMPSASVAFGFSGKKVAEGGGVKESKAPNIKVGPGDVVFITNNVVYIVPLEYGHSQQAPMGMVRITIAEFQSFVAAAIASLP
jgi:hypothetical protein